MDEDMIVLGIVGLVAVYWLVNRGSTAAATGGTGTPLAVTPGGPPVVPAAVPSAYNGPIASNPYWEQVPGGSPGAYRPTAPDTVNPRLGSVANDATLLQLNRMIDSANAAGNWDLSWQIAAKRDAWIKSQGY